MVLFIVSALIALVSLGVGLYLTANFIKKPLPPVPFDKLWKRLLIVIGVFAISFTTMMTGIYLWAKYKPSGYELSAAIIGGLFAGALMPISLFTFLLHYYGQGENKGISELADKWLFRSLMIAFPLMFLAIFYLTEGFSSPELIKYPLPNGINFGKGFVTPASQEGTNLAFYALCILSGAVYVYLLCDHKFYLQYGKHGILESTFILAFPAGILGARIWYVIGNWSREFNNGNSFTELWGMKIWAPLAIWEGGLTILGGAIMGIVVGVAWFMHRNKGYSIWLAVDIIVPTILIAQAVGRWGNFFNCEVHGIESPIAYWNWLPRFIVENAKFSTSNGWAKDGYLWVPLFLIECFTNLLGYFVIAHLFGIKLRKYTELGDLAFGYIVWYGLTRVLMEPLRDVSFNMGENGFWSWIWSLVFVIGGALLIAINHLVRYIKKPRSISQKQYMIGSIAVGGAFLALLIPAIILMASGHFSKALVLNSFTWGLILLALAISILLGLIITLPPLILNKKQNA